MALFKGTKLLVLDVDKTMHYSPGLMMNTRAQSVGIIQSMYGMICEEAIRIYDCERMRAQSSAEVLGRLGFNDGNEVKITEILEKRSGEVRQKLLRYDPELVRLLKDVKAQGMSIFTIRNGTLPVTEITLRSLLGIPEPEQTSSAKEIDRPISYKQELLRGVGPIDTIIPTTELGVLKPDPLPFRMAIELAEGMGIQPTEMMMVGDKASDIFFPKEMGMRTVQVDWRHERQVSNIGADCVIHTIYPLRNIVI